MVVEQWLGKIWRGDAADPRPTGAKVVAGSLYIQKNTGIMEVFDGSTSTWKLVAADPTTFATWIIYKAGSTYKAKSGVTGATAFSGANLKTDVWDNIKSNPVSKTRIHFANASTPYDIAIGSTLDIPSTAADYYVSGESMHGVQIRPLGNNIAMSCTNLRRGRITDLGFLVDQGSAYTTDIMRVIASTGGCSEIELDHIKMRHDDGAGTLNQAGRNIVFLLSGTDPNISWTNCHDCWFLGGDSGIAVSSSAPVGKPWFNENWFTRLHMTWTKRGMLLSMPAIAGSVTESNIHRLLFKDSSWQTTKVEATTLNFFHIATDVSHRGIVLDNCMMWDPLTTVSKFLSINSADVRMVVKDCEPIGDIFMTGTAWDATNGKWNTGVFIDRQTDMTEKRGIFVASGTGAQTVFNIPHGMLDYVEAGSSSTITPKFHSVWPRSTAAGNPTSFTTSVTNTNIVVTYAVAPVTGTNNLTWEWWTRAYV
jgi:hypothetical protein